MWSMAARSLFAVVVAIEVAVVVTGLVPTMVVGDSAALAIPVAFIEERSIMTVQYPSCHV